MPTIAQYIISTPPGFALLVLAFIIVAHFLFRAIIETVRAGARAYKFIRSLFPRFGAKFLFVWVSLSLSGYMARGTITDVAVFAVQSLVSPVYYSQYVSDSTSATEQAYLRKLRNKVSETQYNQFIQATAQMATEHKSTVLNFLEVYESECGMNPFACNINEKGDTIAAGAIQFTRAGVSGLQLDGVPATMRRVKDAIRSRDLSYLLALQSVYMRRAANGRPLKRSCDVYTAVFMPAYVGMPDETVLACSTCARPDFYFENAPALDGYKLSGDKILKSPRYADGKITIFDLSLALAYKKAGVVKMFGNGK